MLGLGNISGSVSLKKKNKCLVFPLLFVMLPPAEEEKKHFNLFSQRWVKKIKKTAKLEII